MRSANRPVLSKCRQTCVKSSVTNNCLPTSLPSAIHHLFIRKTKQTCHLLSVLLLPPLSALSSQLLQMKKPSPTPLNLPSSSFQLTPKILFPKLPSFFCFQTSRTLSSHQTLCSHSQNPSPYQTQTQDQNPLISVLLAVPDWADAIKERGMQQKRSLFNHDKWLEHRSSRRHLRHLLSSLSSRVILSLIPPVFAFTTFAAAIAFYNYAVELHWLPEMFPVLRASSLPYQLTAPALALLLVFRTEASYSRFEEGRKAWTGIVAGTNEFARQVMAGVDSESDAEMKKALIQYIMAFPVALKCHVIYGSDAGRDLQNLLVDDDLALVLSSKHRPRCIIEFISQSLKLLQIDESKRNILESKLACFHEGIGACEQLMGIPIPLSYTRLTSRFLVLWHLTLPVILWDDCNWIVIPATFVSAASLFCIEEVSIHFMTFSLLVLDIRDTAPTLSTLNLFLVINELEVIVEVGVLIEEPFPMLALDELCNLVHNSIQEAIAIEDSIRRQLLARQKKLCQDGHPTNGRPN
ncbi:Voltage-dependent chloride channel 1, chloroplastic [Asimina triloba]